MRSSIALTSGARQLVVHEALEMTVSLSFSSLVVDPENHGAVDVLLARRRDDHLARAGLEVRAGLRLAGEKPGALEDDVHAERAPRQLRRIALGNDLDRVAVHDDGLVLDFHARRKRPVGGVVLQQVRVGLGIAEVVDGDELQPVLLLSLIVGAKNHAPNPSESVDRDFDHCLISPITLLTTFATLSAVKPKCLNTSAAGADSP